MVKLFAVVVLATTISGAAQRTPDHNQLRQASLSRMNEGKLEESLALARQCLALKPNEKRCKTLLEAASARLAATFSRPCSGARSRQSARETTAP